MTTAPAWAPSAERTRAIHGPAQANEEGSTTGTSPSARPPSHRKMVQPFAGSSAGAGVGTSPGGDFEDRRQARHEGRRLYRQTGLVEGDLFHGPIVASR